MLNFIYSNMKRERDPQEREDIKNDYAGGRPAPLTFLKPNLRAVGFFL